MSLSEIVQAIDEGMHFELFEINKTAITIYSRFMFFVVIGLFALASRLLRRLLVTQVFPRLRREEDIQYTLTRISHYVVMVIGAVVAFQFMGVDLTGLAVILGFLSVGIGFGYKM